MQPNSIRRATSADIHLIAELVGRACHADHIPRISEVELAALLVRGEMLVLATSPDSLGAAACLTTAHGHGHLAFLVVDPDMPELEVRMRAVAGALCEAECCQPAFSHAG
ncbi:MAG: hypothetical protein QM831_15820 [Kofleriaceae bacterium]